MKKAELDTLLRDKGVTVGTNVSGFPSPCEAALSCITTTITTTITGLNFGQ